MQSFLPHVQSLSPLPVKCFQILLSILEIIYIIVLQLVYLYSFSSQPNGIVYWEALQHITVYSSYFSLAVLASCRSSRLPAACSKGLSQQIISTHLNTDCQDFLWLFTEMCTKGCCNFYIAIHTYCTGPAPSWGTPHARHYLCEEEKVVGIALEATQTPFPSSSLPGC